MVEAGLLTEIQLNEALAAHRTSGRPLGEVIVSLGFASPGAVATALAEQYGGPLQTEYGVSIGLGRRLELAAELDDADPLGLEAEPAVEPQPTPPPSIRVVPIQETPESAAEKVADAREALGQAARERESLERIGVLEARLGETEELARELAACREREAERRAAVELATPAAAAAVERATAADAQLEELRGRLTALDRDTAEAAAAEEQAVAALAEAHTRAQAAEAELAELRGRVAQLGRDATDVAAARERAETADREVAELRVRLEAVSAELEGARAEPVQPPEPSHVRFVPGPGGYTIAEADGPCPERGAEVKDPEGHAYRVSRVGPSPPGDRRRCAYLEPATA